MLNRRVVVLTVVALIVSMFAMASVATATKKDKEGCTPGYWKAPQHADSYPAGITPGSSLEDTIFGITAANEIPGNPTFLDALSDGGGGLVALLRHAAAAYLNAASGDVEFLYTTTDVRNMLASALASGNYEATKDLFDAANDAGCPLD